MLWLRVRKSTLLASDHRRLIEIYSEQSDRRMNSIGRTISQPEYRPNQVYKKDLSYRHQML
jgi:hypothetical protein